MKTTNIQTAVTTALNHLENGDPVEAESALEMAIPLSPTDELRRLLEHAKEETSIGSPDKAETYLGMVNALLAKQTSATPRPWIVDDRHIHCENGYVYRDERLLLEDDTVCEVNVDCRKGELLTETDKANLALIVKAVNAHDELVAALKLCEDVIGRGRLEGKLSDSGFSPVNDALMAARKALDLVRTQSTVPSSLPSKAD